MRRVIDEHAVKAAGGEVLPGGSGVRVGGWRIATTSGPIAGDATAEALKDELGVLSIPEQYYSSNHLTLTHESSGTTLAFDAASALRAWRAASAADAGHRLHVPASEQWLRSRRGEMEAHGAKELDYDWTFTTDYVGSVTNDGDGNLEENGSDWAPTGDQMDRGMLMARDPILFFDDLPLYESELEDNGVSSLSVKVRVMPRCWYVLLRFFMRVDGVMVRLREARLFCKFEGAGAVDGDNGVVLREIRYQEGRFSELAVGGAPPEGPAYADGDAAATALTAVAPVGVTRYVVERLVLGSGV